MRQRMLDPQEVIKLDNKDMISKHQKKLPTSLPSSSTGKHGRVLHDSQSVMEGCTRSDILQINPGLYIKNSATLFVNISSSLTAFKMSKDAFQLDILPQLYAIYLQFAYKLPQQNRFQSIRIKMPKNISKGGNSE
jgi:hypothetical protein